MLRPASVIDMILSMYVCVYTLRILPDMGSPCIPVNPEYTRIYYCVNIYIYERNPEYYFWYSPDSALLDCSLCMTARGARVRVLADTR